MRCAIKAIRKTSLKSEILKQLNKNELEILEETPHPHIVRVFELMEDRANFYIVTELMTGGNLFQKLKASVGGTFSEDKAASVVKQVMLALNFMHSKKIMHRDLKPENIMCEEATDLADDEIFCKLTDFGFAVKYEPNKKEKISLGSPYYMAPELCAKKPYDEKVDCWAVGVIAFVLLCGGPPFKAAQSQGKQGVFKAIMHSEPDYSRLGDVTEGAIQFIKQCLIKDASERPSIEQLLRSDWMTTYDNSRQLLMRKQIAIGANLLQFQKTSAAQAWICSIIANQLTDSEDLRDARAAFEQWDTNKDGVLSADEIQEHMTEICQYFNMQEPSVMKILKSADSDGNGEIDYTEFLSAASDKKKLLSEKNLKRVFDQLDNDGNGQISKEEIKMLVGDS